MYVTDCTFLNKILWILWILESIRNNDNDDKFSSNVKMHALCTRFSQTYSSSDPAKAKEMDETGSYSRRQRLFFTAITRFAIKNSMGEIERYYANKMRQAPHVIR